jgi:hypothetical protein
MDSAANEQHQHSRAGTTSGATMSGAMFKNVEPLVVRLIDLASVGKSFKSSTRTLVGSLTWVFLARSVRKLDQIPRKNFDRMITSTRHMLVVTEYYSDLRLEGETDDMTHDQDFIKYWTDYHMWRANGSIDEPPVRPTYITHNLFVGWWKLYLLRKRAQYDISFFYSLQKGSRKLWGPLS